MTTVCEPTPAGATPEWMPTLQDHLQDQLSRARQLLGENAAPTATCADQAGQALRQTSDALMSAMVRIGVETPVGWRLHQLRSRLESHLLAASALAEADAQDAVVSVLRRTLQFIGPELEALSTDVLR